MADTKIVIRNAKESDVDGILEVEFERYSTMYKERPEKRDIMKSTFVTRISNAPDWCFIAEANGKIIGFISAMPTSKTLEDFESWEKTTSNGSLEGVIEPDGQNVYVVNLDVSRKWTKKGVQYMLMARLGRKIISSGKNIIFFESRIPMLRKWVKASIGLDRWGQYSEDKKMQKVQSYVKLENEKGDPYDRLLAFYKSSGFKFDRVIADAFQDGESLNYGVICYATNPFPEFIRRNSINPFLGFVAGLLFRYPRILSKIL